MSHYLQAMMALKARILEQMTPGFSTEDVIQHFRQCMAFLHEKAPPGLDADTYSAEQKREKPRLTRQVVMKLLRSESFSNAEIAAALKTVFAEARGAGKGRDGIDASSDSNILAAASSHLDANLVKMLVDYFNPSQSARAAARKRFENWSLDDSIDALGLGAPEFLGSLHGNALHTLARYRYNLLEKLDTFGSEFDATRIFLSSALTDCVTKSSGSMHAAIVIKSLARQAPDADDLQKDSAYEILFQTLTELRCSNQNRFQAIVRCAMVSRSTYIPFQDMPLDVTTAENLMKLFSEALDGDVTQAPTCETAALEMLRNMSSSITLKRMLERRHELTNTTQVIEKALMHNPKKMLSSDGVSIPVIGAAIGFEKLSEIAFSTNNKRVIQRLLDSTSEL